MVFDWLKDLCQQLRGIDFRHERRRSTVRHKAERSVPSIESLEQRVLLSATCSDDCNLQYNLQTLDTESNVTNAELSSSSSVALVTQTSDQQHGHNQAHNDRCMCEACVGTVRLANTELVAELQTDGSQTDFIVVDPCGEQTDDIPAAAQIQLDADQLNDVHTFNDACSCGDLCRHSVTAEYFSFQRLIDSAEYPGRHGSGSLLWHVRERPTRDIHALIKSPSWQRSNQIVR